MRVLTGALSYILTQMSKMLIIAGLVNLTEFWEHLIDCIGLYYSMVHYQKASVASVKILSEHYYFLSLHVQMWIEILI